MTHCAEWENLFKKQPDACVESADYRRKVERWLATLDQIRKRGIQVTTKIFPEGAHRALLALDDETREKALNYICHRLEKGEKITAPDLKKSIAVWVSESASTSCPVRKNNTNVLSSTSNNDEKPATAPQSTSGSTTEAGIRDVSGGTLVTGNKPIRQPIASPVNGDAARVQESTAAAAEHEREKAVEARAAPAPAITLPPWSPDDCRTGHCPDKNNHTEDDKVRGRCCQLNGQPVNQISKCPVIDRIQRADPNSPLARMAAGTDGFHRASGIPSMQGLPHTGGRNPAPIVLHPSPKQAEFLSRVQRIEGYHDLECTVLEIIDRAMEAAD